MTPTLTSDEVRCRRDAAWLAELQELAEDYAREGIPLDAALQGVRDGYEVAKQVAKDTK